MNKKVAEKMKKILIVENQLNWQQVYLDILLADEYLVDVVSILADALSQLEKNVYDIVVIDLRLIDEYMIGYQGLNIIQYAKSKGAKTLVCTGFGTPELRSIVLDQFGADQYMEKESNFDVLGFRDIIKKLSME
jgi:DNA-binding response OmpR family regulator